MALMSTSISAVSAQMAEVLEWENLLVNSQKV
jgi:hypothetical protein